MLNLKTRQKYLKELGLYKGEVDNSEGSLTKKAYRALQDKYFIRKKDKDGIYGKNTDILLQSAYNCRKAKYFKLSEFKCGCKGNNCTGYPTVIKQSLVSNLDTLRKKYDNPITITSGLRCTVYNRKVGGVSNSEHTKGRAVDIYIAGGQSSTHKKRTEIVDYWDTLANSKYAYCNGYMKYVGGKPMVYKSKTMGNATHVNVK